MFTSSIVHIQHGVPAARRTELIASLGSSGFVGMVIGSQLGDFIYYSAPEGRLSHMAMLGSSFGLGLVYLILVLFLTRRDTHVRPQETPAIHRLVFKYWPGMIVLVGLMMGVGLTATTIFLTRFATEQGLKGVGTYFTGYAVSAFIFRVMSRRWTDTVGQHRMVLYGLTGQCIGFALLGFVTREWHFIPPAVLIGFGHALLFPVVVSVGSGVFPPNYRGTGTTLVLGSTELGSLISAPLLGSLINTFKADYGYYPLFLLTSAMAGVVAVVYSLTAARRPVPSWQPSGGPALQNCPAGPRCD
jgi:MFS family permease